MMEPTVGVYTKYRYFFILLHVFSVTKILITIMNYNFMIYFYFFTVKYFHVVTLFSGKFTFNLYFAKSVEMLNLFTI